MERHNVADMDSILTSDGITWAHFPVRDFEVPGRDAEWAGLSQKLHTILDFNGKVLVHCYGGKGRSGMVLTRLLVERGDLAGIALQKIRNVRKGAVETGEQEIWGASGFLING